MNKTGTESEHRAWLRERGNRYMVRLRGSQGIIEVWALTAEDAENAVREVHPGVRADNVVLVPKTAAGEPAFECVS